MLGCSVAVACATGGTVAVGVGGASGNGVAVASGCGLVGVGKMIGAVAVGTAVNGNGVSVPLGSGSVAVGIGVTVATGMVWATLGVTLPPSANRLKLSTQMATRAQLATRQADGVGLFVTWLRGVAGRRGIMDLR